MPKLAMSAIQALAPAPPSAVSAPSTALPSSAASSAALDALYSAALGHGPQTHYLRRFAQFDKAGRTSPGWNGAASFCTLSWAVLRQLWVPALLYVAVLEGLALLAWGAWHWLLPAQAALPWPLLLAVAALVWVLPGMYGDALLHTEIRKRIVNALTQTQSVAEACTLLGQNASSPQRLKNLLYANAAVALIAIAACSVWLPAGAVSAALVPSLPAEPEMTVAQALARVQSPVAGSPPGPEPVPATALAPALQAVPTPAPAPIPAVVPTPVLPAPPLPADKASTPPATAQQPQESSPAKTLPPRAPAPPAKTKTAKTKPPTDTPARTRNPTPFTVSTPSARTAPVGTQPGYYLNVGIFAEEANARKVQARLFNANLPAFRQTLATAQGPRMRVRVGPFRTLQEATAARATLHGMALEAVVFRQ